MNSHQWERAKDIFAAALNLPQEARSSYLLQSCSDDIEIRREIEDLLAADAEAGSFLNPGWLAPFSPFTPEPEFQLAAGDVVSGRFRIVRTLGDGGMGRVYEAHDLVLGVSVALKTLRPEISANPEVLIRFRQEVRIAHRITHPNVCRTYHLDHEIRRIGTDLSSSVDLTFLTMEFLEGQTLQQLLKRNGPLSLVRALMIAQQMAEAIEAAHRMGIIHRDIKPSNVMICPSKSGIEGEDRIVITDLGLAKFEAGPAGSDRSSISLPGQTLGTLSYMSPEQLKGEEAGPATDIYAFGLVLYEMITGCKAFPHSSTVEGAYRRTHQSPSSPRALISGLPLAWEVAVLGCLQIEPIARFRRTTDAVAILEGRKPFSAKLRTLQMGHASGVRITDVAIGLAIVAGLSLFAFGFRYFFARGDSAVNPGELVYLAPVKNETGEKQLDNVTELVQAGLAQSVRINMLAQEHVGDYLQQMRKAPGTPIDEPLARELAMRAGATRVVLTSIKCAHEACKMDVEVQQPDNTPQRYRHHWVKSFSWRNTSGNSAIVPAELLSAVRDASNWIRYEVGESANDIARLDAPPEDVTTSNWTALEYYARAQQLMGEHEKDAAIRLLYEATREDPHFALAYAELGDNLMSEFRAEEARSAYSKAIAFEEEGRLTPRERYFIVATRAIDTNDYQVALDALKSYTDLYPNDYLGWFYLNYPLIELGRTDDAVFALHKAALIDPEHGAALVAAAVAEVSAGRFEPAKISLRQAQAQGASDGLPYVSGMVAFLEGRYEDAEASFRLLESAQSNVYQGVGYSLLASVLAEQGRSADALKVLEEGALHSTNIDDPAAAAAGLMARSYLLCQLARYKECFLALDLAGNTAIDPNLFMQETFVLGTAAAKGSRAVRTESTRRLQILANLSRGRSTDVAGRLMHLRAEGELQAALGNWRASLASFGEADRVDAPIADRTYLGRALAGAAQHEQDPVAARKFSKEAAATFRRTLEQPGTLMAQSLALSTGPAGRRNEGLSASLRRGFRQRPFLCIRK